MMYTAVEEVLPTYVRTMYSVHVSKKFFSLTPLKNKMHTVIQSEVRFFLILLRNISFPFIEILCRQYLL